MAKIDSDPEADDIKLAEFQLWEKIKKKHHKDVVRALVPLVKAIC